MIPTTYAAGLLLLIFTMLCWGSWANTFKLAGKWRFELFYYDYAVGVLIMALALGLIFGSNPGESLTLVDNLTLAGKRKIADGLAAGVVFNLANMLLVGAIAVAGMSVAFPIGIGLALVIGVVWNYILNPQGSALLLGSGVFFILGAIIVDAIAFHKHANRVLPEAAPSPADGGAVPEKKVKKPKRKNSVKGIVLSLISGVLMGSFYPLVEMGRQGDVGERLDAYAMGLVFAIGVFISTFIFNLYFLNLPIQGKSIPMSNYFQGTVKQHLLGIGGGLIWCAGAVANFAVAGANVHVGPAISYAIGQGATMVSALWGILVWKEFAGASKNVRMLVALMLVLFILGLTLLSLAPLYGRA